MMERDYLDIIKEKEFIALSASELKEVAGICSTEEEYNAMKAMMLQIDGVTAAPLTPDPKTKESLDGLFAQTYPKASPIWYNSVLAVIIPKEKPVYRQPLVQIAAAFLIFWMVFPFFNQSLVQENKQMAKLEKKTEQPVIEGVLEDSKQEIVQQEKELQLTNDVVSDIRISENISTRTIEENRPSPMMFEAEVAEISFAEDKMVAAEASMHPDGIFLGGTNNAVAFAQTGRESQDLLDLLTATF